MIKKQSKIEKLLTDLCPNGVEFKELGEIADIGTGSSNGNEAIAEGKYPLFVRSKFIKQIDTFEFDEEAIIIPGEGGVGEIFHYINGKYALHQRCYRIHFMNSEVITKFAYYYLFANFLPYILKKSVNATVKSIRKPMIEKFKIPVPPLAIQEEIVKILNSFTELEAELEARKKQYEHYRSELLTFNNMGGVQWIRLMDIANYSKSRIEAFKLDNESYIGVDNLLQNRQGKTLSSYVPTTGKLTQYENGDILIGNIRPYLKKIWHATNTGGTNGDVLVVRINEKDKVDSEFLYYLLSADKFFDHNMQFAKGAKMPRGDKSAIMKFEIPLPPMVEQKRVASILSNFENLVNNISIGLPAELKARRSQYEYYRGKLLTFNEYVH